jgi:hypothetical protein
MVTQMKSADNSLSLNQTEIEAKARQLRAEWIRDLIFGRKAR